MVKHIRITGPKAIRRFESAVRDHAMKGTQSPELHESIETELEEARRDLQQICAGVTLSIPVQKPRGHYPRRT